MALYVSLVKFRQDGLETLFQEGSRRQRAMFDTVFKHGGRFLKIYHCLGQYDVVAVQEFPDNDHALKANLQNAVLGHLEIATMPAVSHEQWALALADLKQSR